MRTPIRLLLAGAVAVLFTAPLVGQQVAVSADSLSFGGRTIEAGTTVEGPVVVAGGDLTVAGTVNGTAVVIAGDVHVLPGGRITGDAIAAFGSVLVDEGFVGGTARSLTGTLGASMRSWFSSAEPAASQTSPLALAIGWFGVVLLVGIGVFLFARSYLDGVADVLGQSFWRSFAIGVIGELGIFPVIALTVVALVATVVGILLIPFAIVAGVLAAAGLLALGFMAVASLAGGGFGSRKSSQSSGEGLRSIVFGLTFFMGLWVIAALLHGVPVVGTVVELLAAATTYVATTAGFGAALLSRAGTRRDAAVPAAPPSTTVPSWQTPTPVAGVIAPRRSSTRAQSR
jgi:hypothetical protein